MAFIEMARDEVHGGGAWAFKRAIFSPTRNKTGGKSAYWSKILDVKKGDLILHLRGKPPEAAFVGTSIAADDGYETTERPPYPGTWNFSERFYKADLENFTPFSTPFNLDEIFSKRRSQLEEYFSRNKDKKKLGKNLFYVPQRRKKVWELQCQNGAYLSDLDSELMIALFGGAMEDRQAGTSVKDVVTSSQLRQTKARIGQQEFSDTVKRNYGNHCCFPNCPISDVRFLIGSHIARWGDNETLRGSISNGLCLCVFHDKAFEVGFFAIDADHKVFLNKRYVDWSAYQAIAPFNGHSLKKGQIAPSSQALAEHWGRIKIQFT